MVNPSQPELNSGADFTVCVIVWNMKCQIKFLRQSFFTILNLKYELLIQWYLSNVWYLIFFGYWLQKRWMTFLFFIGWYHIIIETSFYNLLHVHENIKRMKEWYMHAISYTKLKQFISMFILSDFDFFVKYAINKCVN